MKSDPKWLKKPKNTKELFELLSDKMWRLHNLYYIIDEWGKKVPFIPRPIQLDFLKNRHGLDIILKARQLGFSTMIQIDMLDDCLFVRDVNAAIIAQSLPDAKEIFRTKIKTPYEKLPRAIRESITSVSDSKDVLELNNGSQLRVGTSMRSSTVQNLHISEYGKICAKFPDKAEEIRTGALNAIQMGQKVAIESTAEGKEGGFYEMCTKAMNLKRSGVTLTPMDFKFHFYPWHVDPKYTLNADVTISAEMEEYFDELRLKHGIKLTAGQMAWYVKKHETQQDEMKREFPSTPDEAFESSAQGAYFHKQMAKAREEGRIGRIPYNPAHPVHTTWDLGGSEASRRGDNTSIWFFQCISKDIGFIDYYENSGELLSHYAQVLQEKKYVYGNHYLPHDSKKGDMRKEGNIYTDAEQLLTGEIYLVPRIPVKQDAINMARNIFIYCWFDEAKCAQGIKHLDNYRKEWNATLGQWRNAPRHDDASHGADAFMTFAQGFAMEGQEGYDEPTGDDIQHEMDEDTGY